AARPAAPSPYQSARVSGAAALLPTRSCPSEPCSAPFLGLRGLCLLDEFDLRAVGRFEEADAAAVVRRQFFEDAYPILPQLRHRPGIVVGVEGDVLDAVM